MRAVTKVAVREARLKEIKAELINSQKLKVRTSTSLRTMEVVVYWDSIGVQFLLFDSTHTQ